MNTCLRGDFGLRPLGKVGGWNTRLQEKVPGEVTWTSNLGTQLSSCLWELCSFCSGFGPVIHLQPCDLVVTVRRGQRSPYRPQAGQLLLPLFEGGGKENWSLLWEACSIFHQMLKAASPYHCALSLETVAVLYLKWGTCFRCWFQRSQVEKWHFSPVWFAKHIIRRLKDAIRKF